MTSSSSYKEKIQASTSRSGKNRLPTMAIAMAAQQHPLFGLSHNLQQKGQRACHRERERERKSNRKRANSSLLLLLLIHHQSERLFSKKQTPKKKTNNIPIGDRERVDASGKSKSKSKSKAKQKMTRMHTPLTMHALTTELNSAQLHPTIATMAMTIMMSDLGSSLGRSLCSSIHARAD